MAKSESSKSTKGTSSTKKTTTKKATTKKATKPVMKSNSYKANVKALTISMWLSMIHLAYNQENNNLVELISKCNNYGWINCRNDITPQELMFKTKRIYDILLPLNFNPSSAKFISENYVAFETKSEKAGLLLDTDTILIGSKLDKGNKSIVLPDYTISIQTVNSMNAVYTLWNYKDKVSMSTMQPQALVGRLLTLG